MSRKNKFDLSALVHEGVVKAGDKLSFVSDPSKSCQVLKMPNGDFKVTGADGKPTTVHAFATYCLGQEPPEHASKWIKAPNGKTLYELWHAGDEDSYLKAA
jgi:hypothetical protein